MFTRGASTGGAAVFNFMHQGPFDYQSQQPIRSSWNESKYLIRGPLTDKKIDFYRKRGWYDPEFQEARRELMAKKKAKRDAKRDGSFLKMPDGRLIYSPL